MSSRQLSFLICAAVVVGLSSVVPAQQEGEIVQVAVPINTSIVTNESLAILIGKPVESSTLGCAPGFEHPHSAVIIDPGGGRPAQRSDIVVFRYQSEPAKNGTRILLEGDGAPCNADYKLYTGTVN
jgi:hypothetical protein